jgi:hypothetical protein
MRIARRITLFLTLVAFPLAVTALAGVPNDAPQVKAYQDLLKAVQAGDYEGYKKSMTKAAAEGIAKETKEMGMDPKKALEFLKAMSPTDLKYTSLKVDGKKATLEATGKVGGELNKGTIALEQEGEKWKVANQSWTNAK